MDCPVINSGFFTLSQRRPSENCCMEKIKGIAANKRCALVCAPVIAIAPAIESTALAPKLAVAEKHMITSLFFKMLMKHSKNVWINKNY
jgi:hypothetical protein